MPLTPPPCVNITYDVFDPLHLNAVLAGTHSQAGKAAAPLKGW